MSKQVILIYLYNTHQIHIIILQSQQVIVIYLCNTHFQPTMITMSIQYDATHHLGGEEEVLFVEILQMLIFFCTNNNIYITGLATNPHLVLKLGTKITWVLHSMFVHHTVAIMDLTISFISGNTSTQACRGQGIILKTNSNVQSLLWYKFWGNCQR